MSIEHTRNSALRKSTGTETGKSVVTGSEESKGAETKKLGVAIKKSWAEIENLHKRGTEQTTARPTEQRPSIVVGENIFTVTGSSITTEGNSLTIVLQLEHEPEPPLDQEVAEAFRETIEGLQHIIDKMAGRDPQEVSIVSIARNSPLSVTIGFEGSPDEIIQVLNEIRIGRISSPHLEPGEVTAAFIGYINSLYPEEEIRTDAERFQSLLDSVWGKILAQAVTHWAEHRAEEHSVQYNSRVIRNLLEDAFDDKELKRLLQDRSEFHSILAKIVQEDSLSEMIDIVIGYCQRQRLFPELLEEIKKRNPKQYDRYKDVLSRR